jgi:hypothetical protein
VVLVFHPEFGTQAFAQERPAVLGCGL